jgi:hypothetical protein
MNQPSRTRSAITHAVAFVIGIVIGIAVAHPDGGCNLVPRREPAPPGAL